MKKSLTIAGSDSCGGAGIQADIKAMSAMGVYAMSAVTALTAQNTQGVFGILEVEADFLGKQLDAIFTDIYPDSVKIGMVASKELINKIAEKLKEFQAKNIVVDPVMVATSGASLMQKEALDTLKNNLLPVADIVTPNILEGEILAEMKICNKTDMEIAAKKIGDNFGCAVLLKGGHSEDNADDCLYDNGEITWFSGDRIDNPNNHGTGCTLSSAIAACLAKGYSVKEGITKSKEYITDALKAGLDLGKGSGPLNHFYFL